MIALFKNIHLEFAFAQVSYVVFAYTGTLFVHALCHFSNHLRHMLYTWSNREGEDLDNGNGRIKILDKN